MTVSLALRFLDTYNDVETYEGHGAIFPVPNTVKGLVKVTVKDKAADAEALTVSFTGVSKFFVPAITGPMIVKLRKMEEVITDQTTIVETGWRANAPVGIGVYVYEFEFDTMDEDGRLLYSSLEDLLGKIEYKVEAKIYSKRQSNNCTLTKKVILTNRLHIDRLPETDRKGMEARTETELSYLCWNSGSVRLVAEISKGAYRPGETIEIKMYVSNFSQKRITPKIDLIKRSHFMKDGLEETCARRLVSHEIRDAVIPMIEECTRTMRIRVPESLLLGSILDISYFKVTYGVQVTMSIPWYNSGPNLWFPIVIGQ